MPRPRMQVGPMQKPRIPSGYHINEYGNLVPNMAGLGADPVGVALSPFIIVGAIALLWFMTNDPKK